MPKIKTAAYSEQIKCDCGCGYVYGYLCDADHKQFARFSLHRDDWIPFAEDCVRLCDDEEVLGQRPEVVQ